MRHSIATIPTQDQRHPYVLLSQSYVIRSSHGHRAPIDPTLVDYRHPNR